MATIPPILPHCDSLGCSDNTCCPGKQAWPELIGMKAIDAKPIIERENPKVTVVIGLTGAIYRKPDLCCNIVWIWVDDLETGVITDRNIPRVG